MSVNNNGFGPPWLDGPRLVEWLEENVGGFVQQTPWGPTYPHLDWTQRRRIRSWRQGVRASLAVLDPILLNHDVSLWEVPEDLYVR